MILKRYGEQLHSVAPNFDPHAMNEIGFQRTDEHSLTAEEFEARYQRDKLHELTASAEGHVQSEAEAAVLSQLSESLEKLRAALSSGDLLVIESESGRDYPKLRETVKNEVHEGTNRLRFYRTVEPPLRVAVYRPRQS
jgi:hypothetical protein